MGDRLAAQSDVGLDEALLRLVIDEHARGALPRLEKLWTYYRNAIEPVAPAADPWARPASWYRQGQEVGLPARQRPRDGDDRGGPRRETVIENDIAWRIHTMVDFLFGRPIAILSTAADARLRQRIDRTLDAAWSAWGGVALLQDAALLGHVFGSVDFVLRLDAAQLRSGDAEGAVRRGTRLEVVDPTRGIPLLDPNDYRRVVGYLIHFRRQVNRVESDAPSFLRRRTARRATEEVTEVFTPARRRLSIDGRRADDEPLSLLGGRLPVVHVQNLSQPFVYTGLSDVEPLIPLQDELNTRLSDRAARVTFQSFKMYLAKGLDGFEKSFVGPGQIWSTDNPDAQIQAFGGDAHSPSEDRHVDEIREALDKISAVPPIAAGVVRAKIGNLSSANALRVTLLGLTSKTQRKRITYGRGVEEVCRLLLTALDSAGLLKTAESDRGVRIEWPDPLPIDRHDEALTASRKIELGVPRARVLGELGYAPDEQGRID